MRNRLVVLLLMGTLGFSFASHKATINLDISPPPLNLSFRVPLVLRVAPPRDLRPKVEQEGQSSPWHYFVPGLLIWFGEQRGSHIAGRKDYITAPMPAVHRSLVQHFQQRAAFAGVTDSGPAHLELRTQVLHLYGHRYRSFFFMVADSAAAFSQECFAPYGNAVFRIQLVDLRGGAERILMERVVNGTSAGLPGAAFTVAAEVRNATARAIHNAWYWTTATARQYTDPGNEMQYLQQLEARCPQGNNSCAFRVLRIGRFHEQVDLATVSVEKGRVQQVQRIVKDNLDIVPPGKAGEWLLSPWDQNNMPYPMNYYNALAKFLTKRGFVVRRLDQFSVYHFFGMLGRPGDPPSERPAGPTTL